MCFKFATAITTLAVLATAIHQHEGNTNGVALTIIKNSSLLNPDDTINIDALNSHTGSVRAKLIRGLENYERNTGMVHPAVVKKSEPQRRAGGTGVGLTSHKSPEFPVPFFWYTTLTIGTPPKSFSVDIDTASSDLFVPGSDCPTCRGHKLWNPTVDSSSAKAENRRFYAKFADKSYASGYLFTDNVTLGGLTADNQVIGAARIYSSRFLPSRFPADGIMGLAFGALSNSGRKTVFETLIHEYKLPEAAFSIKLTPDAGELYIGGSNDQLYDGDFTYTRVTHPGHWQVNVESVVGHGSYGDAVLNGVDAIIDTGATLITGDRERVARFHEELGGILEDRIQGLAGDFYSYPCDDFPTVSLTFNGRPFQILESTLNLGRLFSDECTCAIFGQDGGPTVIWVIGGAFLESVYTKFDLGHLRVGFADLA